MDSRDQALVHGPSCGRRSEVSRHSSSSTTSQTIVSLDLGEAASWRPCSAAYIVSRGFAKSASNDLRSDTYDARYDDRL